MSESSVSSYVYVIGPEGGPLKIGISTRPQNRARQIQTAHPRRVAVYGSWLHSNARAVEMEAHRLLAAWRLSGEWFEVDQTRAAAAIAQAIAHVDSDYHSQFTLYDRPSVLAEIKRFLSNKPITHHVDSFAASSDLAPLSGGVDGEFRLGYARHVPGCDLVHQIEWLEESGVGPLALFIETNRRENTVFRNALREIRPGDRFLVMSREVLGGPEFIQRLLGLADKLDITVQFRNECITAGQRV